MSLSHKQAFKLLQKAEDGRLDAKIRTKLDDHLSKCEECQALVTLHRQLKSTGATQWLSPDFSTKERIQAIADIKALVRRGQITTRIAKSAQAFAWGVAAIFLILFVRWIFVTAIPKPVAEAEKQTPVVAVDLNQQATDAAASTPTSPRPTNAEVPEISDEGWKLYTNIPYGFSFRYPPDWTLEEKPNFVRLHFQNVNLSIRFRRPLEETSIKRQGMRGEGELVSRGTVSFLGEELPKEVVVWKDQEKAVLYNQAIETQVDDLIFTLSLDDFSPDYDAAVIKPEIQALADRILASFQWLDATLLIEPLNTQSSLEDIHERRSYPLWRTLWIAGQAVYHNPMDNTQTAIFVQAWLEHSGKGRALASEQIQGVERSAETQPRWMWLSDGSSFSLFDLKERSSVPSYTPRWSQHPLETAPMVRMFLSDPLELEGVYQVVGEETLAGRKALVVDWRSEGSPWVETRLWLDSISGATLRIQQFGRGEADTRQLFSDFMVTDISYNAVFQEGTFSLSTPLPQRFAENYQDIADLLAEGEPATPPTVQQAQTRPDATTLSLSLPEPKPEGYFADTPLVSGRVLLVTSGVWDDEQRLFTRAASHLYTIDLQGTTPPELKAVIPDLADIDVAPGGNRLFYVTEKNAGRNDDSSVVLEYAIYTVSLDGSPPELLAGPFSLSTYMALSPDGRYLAYATRGSDTPGLPGDGELYLLDLICLVRQQGCGGQAFKIAMDIAEGRLTWSPDSRFLAVEDRRDILLVDVGTNPQFPPITNLTESLQGGGYHPVWLPDGEHLLFFKGASPYAMKTDLLRANLKTGGIEVLYPDISLAFDYALSPDGKTLAIAGPRPDQSYGTSIWLWQIGDKDLANLIQVGANYLVDAIRPDYFLNPSFSPEAKFLLFTVGSERVAVLDVEKEEYWTLVRLSQGSQLELWGGVGWVGWVP